MYCGFVCKYKKNLACEILRLRRVAICDMFLIRRSAILTECFLCNGNEVSYYIKNRLKLLLETVIKSYYRGTTHLDHPVHSLMYYHTRLIDNGFGSRQAILSYGFRLPSKGHSIINSIRQSHHQPLSLMSFDNLLFFLNGFNLFILLTLIQQSAFVKTKF